MYAAMSRSRPHRRGRLRTLLSGIQFKEIGRKLLLFGLLAYLAYLVLTTIPPFLELMSQRRRGARLLADIRQLQIENEALLHRVHLLREPDSLAMERLAREKLGMVRPGERVYYFPAVPDSSAPKKK
jgi:cell division protein FtsB